MNNEFTEKPTHTDKKADSDLDFSSVMLDGREGRTSEIDEIVEAQRKIQEEIRKVTEHISRLAHATRSLPPESQAQMRSAAAYMAAKGEPAFEQFANQA